MSEPAGNILELLLEYPSCKTLVVVTQEFKVEMCVCGYHFNKHCQILEKHISHIKMTTQCVKFNAQYTMVVQTVGTRQKIDYVPKFMLSFTYYFLIHDGEVFDER